MKTSNDQDVSTQAAAHNGESSGAIDLTLVTPAFNEGAALSRNIGDLVSALESLDVAWEYILVDDGSTDNSLEIMRQATAAEPRCRIIHYDRNRGRGYALRRGFAAARGAHVVATESDLSWGPEIVGALYESLRESGSDIVIASVYLPKGGFVNVPAFRRYLSSLGNVIMRWSFGSGVTMLSGMTRGYRREALRRLPLCEDRKEVHLEIVSKAQALNMRIVEIPAVIRWAAPKPGQKRRGGLGILRFVVPHLLVSFNQGAVKLLMTAGFLLGALGLASITISTLNKLFRILPVLVPNLATYGLVLCVLAGLVGMLALVSIQLRFVYQAVVQVQSRLLEQDRAHGGQGRSPDPARSP